MEGITATDEQDSVGSGHGYCLFRGFLVSFETMRRQFSAFWTSTLSRTILKKRSLKGLITSTMFVVEAALSSILKKTTREVSRNSAGLEYLVDMLRREENGVVMRDSALFWTVLVVAAGSRCKRNETISSNI